MTNKFLLFFTEILKTILIFNVNYCLSNLQFVGMKENVLEAQETILNIKRNVKKEDRVDGFLKNFLTVKQF